MAAEPLLEEKIIEPAPKYATKCRIVRWMVLIVAFLIISAALAASLFFGAIIGRKEELETAAEPKIVEGPGSPISCSNSQLTTITRAEVKLQVGTFRVDDVAIEKPTFKPASVKIFASNLEAHWDSKSVRNDSPPIVFGTGEANNENLVDTGSPPSQHALFATVLTAYNSHLPLVLGPDHFWLLISLAVGQFLGGDPKMAEKYRKQFVQHEGKKQLFVKVDGYGIVPKDPKANRKGWPLAIRDMAKLIEAETETDLAEIMTQPFSTTRGVEQTVMRVALMETMKSYFEYIFIYICGIPEITLEGSLDDYGSILDRIDRLIKIFPDFKWYLKRVKMFMEKVYASKNGDIDREWWQTMVSHREAFGGCARDEFYTGID